MRTILTTLLVLFQVAAFTQNTIWTSQTLKLSQDTASLADMAGANMVSLPTTEHKSAEMTFANGFTFRYGLQQFYSFAVSKYGYLKLGGPINGIGAESQDSVIAPFFHMTWFGNIRYKYLGAAPYRVFVTEWSGFFSPSSQAITFQLHLHESNGRIQMLYSGNTAFTTLHNPYTILLRMPILNKVQVASLDVRTDTLPAKVDYRSLDNPLLYWDAFTRNYEAIKPKTRYTFQPDTSKPVRPVLSFINVLPGCLSVKPEYDSVHASVFSLQKQEGSNSNRSLGLVFTGQYYTDTSLLPDRVYTYGGFASNGFLNSDPIISSVRTPMPLIYGVKMIPGDYPSINALLADAKCKHIGPELTIELQNNYTYSLEPSPVRFLPRYQHDHIRRITIQPAAGASVVLSNNVRAPLFHIDSVKFVGFDGRAGGMGTDRSLTFNQQDSSRPAIYYVNKADSGRIEYCIIDCVNKSSGGLIQLTGRDEYYQMNRYSVDGTVIRNCKIGSTTSFAENAVVIEGNYGKGCNITIEDNEFFRFRREAILMNYAGYLNKVLRNRFYQPEYFYVYGDAAIKLEGTGDQTLIEGNRFGGSVAEWGKGKWRTTSPEDYRFILSRGNGYVTIRNNEFANIYIDGFRTKAIEVTGPALLEGNKVGSTDSLRSFEGRNHVYGFRLDGSDRKRIQNNTFSGMYAGSDLYVIVANSTFDSVIVINNDLGGSDQFHTNFANYLVRGISTFPSRVSIIRNNKIRGMTAGAGSIKGIDVGTGFVTPGYGDAFIDSNEVHHLQGRQTVYGIAVSVNSNALNRASYNNVYALRAIGPSLPLGANQPAITCGISLSNYLGTNTDNTNLVIHNNTVHSFEYLTPQRAYWYSMVGISSSSTNRTRVYNNVVRLGTSANGSPTDSLETAITGITTEGKRQEIEHNSIYIGGTGTSGMASTGISVQAESSKTGEKTAFISNNIIQLDRKEPGSYKPTYIGGYYQYGAYNTLVSNYNLWYSDTDTSIATALRKWQTDMKCDSNTIIADPLFINPRGDSASFDLHLREGTPTDRSGTPSFSDIKNDRDDRDRSAFSPIDIGAYANTPCATASPVSIAITSGTERVVKCPGSPSQLSATVTGTVKGLQWQKNLHNIPGATTTSLTITEPGTYRLVATVDCGMVAGASVHVVDTIINPLVTVNRNNYSDVVCEGGTLTLRAWLNGTTSPVLKWYKNGVWQQGKDKVTETFDGVRANDLFKVEVLDQSMCPSTVTDTFRLYSTSPAKVTEATILSYQPSGCYGKADTVRYRVTNTEAFRTLIEFYPGSLVPFYNLIGDSLLIFPNLNASTRLRIISGVGQTCSVPDTTEWITITGGGYLPKPTITQSGSMLVSSSSVNNQWYEVPSTPIPGATGQSFIPSREGQYYVRLIQGNCLSDTSNTISYKATALPAVNRNDAELQVFPNPAKDKLWIRSGKLQGRVGVVLYDTHGREVLQATIRLDANSPYALPLPPLPTAFYTMKLVARDKEYQLKVFVDQ